MKHLKYLLSLFIFVCLPVFAASSPMDMLQSTSNQALAQLKQNQATLKTNPKVVYQIVNNILAPHFAMQEMARMVVGRNAWNAASPSDRAQFVQQFKQLLMRTYSSALASYQNETVKFMPMRGDANSNRVQVNSMIIRQAGPSVSVNYRLIQMGSEWKVYDVSVDGISLVESYRTQFAAQLSQGGSLATLTQKLSQRNG